MYNTCLTHELVLHHVLVHQKHEVFETLALLKLFLKNFVQFLV